MLAYRLSAECPRCKGELVMRRNKSQGNLFLGCIAYPLCSFTEDAVPIITALGNHKAELEEAQKMGIDAQSAMMTQLKLKRTEEELAAAKSALATANLLLAAYRLESRMAGPLNADDMSKRILKAIAVLHPDRWDDCPASVEAAKQLNDLREYVTRGR